MKKFIIIILFYLSAQALSLEKISVYFENSTYFLAELAITPEEKALGLSFRKKKDNFALLFWYDKAEQQIFWMKDMNFAIDILWIRDNKIVWIEKNVPPPNILSKLSSLPTYGHGILADKVLELPAGSTKKHHIKKGDRVSFKK